MSDSDTDVVVRGASSGFAQEVRVRGHVLLGDEPLDQGGTDTGPNPYDLLLAALGTCTSMTVSMYARRKGWALLAVEVRLRHSRIHAEDCADCETKVETIDRIEREITLEGELDEAQRMRLLEMAERCPVHRTLTGEIRIATKLV